MPSVKLTFPHAADKGETSFVLADDAIREMGTAVAATESTKLEHGFPFCSTPFEPLTNPPVLHAGPMCKGDICSISIGGCRLGDGRPADDFHTHPSGNPEPSVGDMLATLSTRIYGSVPPFACRSGAVMQGPTRCDYVLPTDLPTRENFEQMQADYLRDVRPAYDKWVQTGVYPADHPGWATYKRLEEELDPLFHSVHFDTQDSLRAGVRLDPKKRYLRFDLGRGIWKPALSSGRAERVQVGVPPAPIPVPLVPVPAPRPTRAAVQACDELYSYKEIKALAAEHDLPRHLTRKDQMCAELVERGVL